MTDQGSGASEQAGNRILLIDDEPPILRALQRELRGLDLEIVACNDPRAALERIEREQFALILTDNRMPGMTGVELLEEVKRVSPDSTRIILTGYTDLESAISAINKGEINFYINKPWNREELLAHVREGLEKYRLKKNNERLAAELTEKNQILTVTNAELRNLAVRDQMTGLYNHAEFESNLERQIKLFQRDGQPFCLTLGDIDNFKRVNDTYGHPVGDTVIRNISGVLLTTLRDAVDTSYRYGGEEFAVLLRNTREADARMVTERMLKKIAAIPVRTETTEFTVTMSFGVGEFPGGSDRSAFVARVDQALYHAKHTGKNRVVALAEMESARPPLQGGARPMG